MRNPDKMVKKTIVSSNASCIKEWLMSCFPKGPLLRLVALGSVDLQWGLDVVWFCGFVVGNSPSTNGKVSLVLNPCEWK